jgi:ABC-2 type transport system ATP-binding protein
VPDVVVDLADIAVRVGRRLVVQQLSLRLAAGSWHGLVGANGSGKTTVMRAALGLVRPTAGRVRLFGAPAPARPGLVGVSFGPRLLHPARRVRAELALRVAAVGGGPADLEAAWAHTGLTDRRLRCGALSLGQAQRVSVTCALVGSPRLLVLDEPTVGLDVGGVDWLRERLADLVSSGGCVWVSSHDLSEVERAADDVTVLDAGRVRYAGPTHGLLGSSDVVRVASSRPEALRRALAAAGVAYVVDGAAGVVVRGAAPHVVGEVLAREGVPVVAMSVERTTLDLALRGLAEGAERRSERLVSAG